MFIYILCDFPSKRKVSKLFQFGVFILGKHAKAKSKIPNPTVIIKIQNFFLDISC